MFKNTAYCFFALSNETPLHNYLTSFLGHIAILVLESSKHWTILEGQQTLGTKLYLKGGYLTEKSFKAVELPQNCVN